MNQPEFPRPAAPGQGSNPVRQQQIRAMGPPAVMPFQAPRSMSQAPTAVQRPVVANGAKVGPSALPPTINSGARPRLVRPPGPPAQTGPSGPLQATLTGPSTRAETVGGIAPPRPLEQPNGMRQPMGQATMPPGPTSGIPSRPMGQHNGLRPQLPSPVSAPIGHGQVQNMQPDAVTQKAPVNGTRPPQTTVGLPSNPGNPVDTGPPFRPAGVPSGAMRPSASAPNVTGLAPKTSLPPASSVQPVSSGVGSSTAALRPPVAMSSSAIPATQPGIISAPPPSVPGTLPGRAPPSVSGVHPNIGPPPMSGAHPSVGPLPVSSIHPSMGPPPVSGAHPSMGTPPVSGGHPGVGPPVPGTQPSMGPPPVTRPNVGPPAISGMTPSALGGGHLGGVPTTMAPAPGPPLNPGLKGDDNMLPGHSTMQPPGMLRNGYLQGQSQPPQYPSTDQTRYTYSGVEPVDLLQNRHILPPMTGGLPPPKPRLQTELWNSLNCSTDIFRCTLTKVPETESVLKKSRLPLGVLIHPFRDLSHLPVIQCSTIVRCRQCRTYINPFVHFVDQRRWRCNICYRVNDLPEEFLYDPVSKSYGDPSRRPECKSSTIEFIAPSEYMLRPPQPAVYIFCLDVSRQATESGYLEVFCNTLKEELDKLPGDGRTQVGFITYDRSVHFYSMPEGASQPTQLNVSDVDDMFLPSPSDLLVNLSACKALVEQLLTELPTMFKESYQTESALGAALQAAYKMTSPTGGRITLFQASLPNVGPGAVAAREIQGGSGDKNAGLLGPATDFYKKLALDCSGQQVAVDLFSLSSQYIDLATLSGVSKFSGGQVQHFPGYHSNLNLPMAAKFEACLRRYLTRKIGFEAVMRIRCTRGLTPHTFHGNFFVRSTDLLSLPNINPDAGFAMQVSIEDDLRDSREVAFQAALLYTSSKGERRIRVHTLCLPTTSSVQEVINGADQQAVIGMLAKFASERSINDSLSDAKEGLVVSCVDTIETYKSYSSYGHPTGLLISQSLKLLPLYVLATMRTVGFRPNQRLDDRTYCFSQMKTLPLVTLLQYIYPDLYRIDDLSDANSIPADDEDDEASSDDASSAQASPLLVPQPSRLQLSYERISAVGMYLLDMGDQMYIYVCRGIHQYILEKVFGVTRIQDLDENLSDFPDLDTAESDRIRTFVQWLNGVKPFPAAIRIIREDGKHRQLFTDRMIEDRMDNSFSYFEFLQHLRQQVKV